MVVLTTQLFRNGVPAWAVTPSEDSTWLGRILPY